MGLDGRLVNVDELTAVEQERMLALMQKHYEGLTPGAFAADLAEKQWVVQLYHDKELCGFSTQMVLAACVGGRTVKALFSGDTIIDRDHWGEHALMKLGGELALSLAEANTEEEWYWFLISQGYKTYRFLPVFFHEFWPRYDLETPPTAIAVLNAFATKKYGDQFDPVGGIIRPHDSAYHLRQGVAEVTPARLRDPHVRFFVQRNPKHIAGDELCCIAPLSRANFTNAALRVLGISSSRLK